MAEQKVTLKPVPGIDLDDYCATLLKRFGNVHIKDQVQRLAQDGSSKLQNTMVPPVKENLLANRSIEFAALATAGWARYLTGIDENGESIVIDDPLANKLKDLALASKSDIKPFIAFTFGDDLSESKSFVKAVQSSLDSIYARGTASTLADLP